MKKIRERIAEIIHETFGHNFNYLMSKRRSLVGPTRQSRDGQYWAQYEFPAAVVEKMQRQAETPYEKLPDSEKDSRRDVAERIIEAILKEGLKEERPVRKLKKINYCGACMHRRTAGYCEEFPFESIDAHDGGDCTEFEAGYGLWSGEEPDDYIRNIRLRDKIFAQLIVPEGHPSVRSGWRKQYRRQHEPAHIIELQPDRSYTRVCDGAWVDPNRWRRLTPFGVTVIAKCPACEDLRRDEDAEDPETNT